MTIYNCVYKTITSPKKIRKLYRDKDIAMMDSILEKYDNCIQFCNLQRTLNMLKDSYISLAYFLSTLDEVMLSR